jgi:hypothetical protein
MSALRAGKSALHQQRTQMQLREKIQIVLYLQRLCLPLIERRRQLEAWERPWPITP